MLVYWWKEAGVNLSNMRIHTRTVRMNVHQVQGPTHSSTRIKNA
jgi:hypothetical protein